MTGVRHWLRSRLVVALLVLVAVAIGGVRAYDALQPRPPQRPLPAASASLHEVATAYLDAAVRQDCGMTRALSTAGARFSWCTSPTMTSYRALTGPTVLTSKQVDGPEQKCMSFWMTNTESSDGSLQAGDQPWDLCFVSTPAGWRVANQGQG